MQYTRFATICLLAMSVMACDAQRGNESAAAPTAAVDEGPAVEPEATPVSAQEFMSGLKLDFPHQVADQRQVRMKGKKGRADVFSIDYMEGSVRTIDRKLAAALATSGFERGDRVGVRGGVRVSYAAADGRRVSTMIRNKKYFGDRIPAEAKGQISLTYAPR